MTTTIDNPAYLLFLFFSPVLVSVIKQSGFSRQANSFIALGVYVAVGILAALLSGTELTAENLAPLATTAALVGTTAYQLFWSKLGEQEDGTTIEGRLTQATSLVK